MSDTSQQLAKAYELIVRDQVEDAYQIIKPITDAEPNNTDAWWLLSMATADPYLARRALITVLKLNPAHPKARPLLDQLNEAYPPRDEEIMQMMAIEEADPDAPAETSANFVDDPFSEADSFEDFGDDPFSTTIEKKPTLRAKTTSDIDALFVEEEEDPFASLLEDDVDLDLDDDLEVSKPAPRRRRLFLVALLMLLCLCLVGVAVLSMGGGGGSAESEPVFVEWTPVTSDVVSAENTTDLEQTLGAVQISAQSGLGTAAEAAYVQLPDSTYALVVTICSDPSPELPNLVQQSMDFIARDIANRTLLEAHIAQVGLLIRDCVRQEDILYRVLSPWSAARDYSAAIGDSQAFSIYRATWQVDS